MPDSTNKLKILVIRFSSIGDIVLTTPVVRTLKTSKRNIVLHYLTKKSYISLLESNPYIDKIYAIQKDINEVLPDLRNENYDYVIDLHHNLRTKILKLKLRRPSFSFDKLNFRKWLLVQLKWDKMPDIHIVDRYMNTVSSLGIENDGLGLDFFIPKKDEYLLDFKFIVIVLGATHFTKRIPIEILRNWCSQITSNIVLIGGKDVLAESQIIENEFKDKILNLCGQININQSASVINQATLVITPDTGMMHIAAALNKKIISIWGNTSPKFGMYPYFANCVNKDEFNIMVERTDINCRPCSKIGFNKCPKGHFDCMDHSWDKSWIVENVAVRK